VKISEMFPLCVTAVFLFTFSLYIPATSDNIFFHPNKFDGCSLFSTCL